MTEGILATDQGTTSSRAIVDDLAGRAVASVRLRARAVGLTRDTGVAELAKAALEAACYQTHDLLVAMARDADAALGATYLAGLGHGVWDSLDAVRVHWTPERRFEPAIGEAARDEAVRGWHTAVRRVTFAG